MRSIAQLFDLQKKGKNRAGEQVTVSSILNNLMVISIDKYKTNKKPVYGKK